MNFHQVLLSAIASKLCEITAHHTSGRTVAARRVRDFHNWFIHNHFPVSSLLLNNTVTF